jgi:hypothetical protein
MLLAARTHCVEHLKVSVVAAFVSLYQLHQVHSYAVERTISWLTLSSSAHNLVKLRLNTDLTVCLCRSDRLLFDIDSEHIIVQVPYCFSTDIAEYLVRCLLTNAQILP